jgi:hypothetical protein
MSAAPAQDSQKGCETKDLPTSDTGAVDIIGYIVFIVLAGAAIWYGWKFGIRWAPAFWAKIQNYGLGLGSLIFGKKGTN